MSAALGLSDGAAVDRLRELLEGFGLATQLPAGLAPDALVERIRLDKKADARGLRFVLWEGAGKARVVSGVPEDAVLAVL